MRKILCISLITTATMGFRTGSGSFYDFKVKDIDGKEFDFSTLRGKTVMIVNTASECGYTPQYKELEELYQVYKSKNFIILGFPSNDFGSQEPGSNSEIKEFCSKNYGVTFPMMEKIVVKGESCHPLYQWLTRKEKNGVLDAEVRWNFNKFLVSADGKTVRYFASKVRPMDTEITKHISSDGK
ncbi:MAG: glutathione peroxidase [Bacteroidia bacterium]|nr:glutathione peroxidase [Bacteroidia bacterium]